MTKSLPYFSRLVLLFASAAISIAQTDHTSAFTGTWKLNVAKSKFSPGPPPKSVTVTNVPDGTFTVEGVDARDKQIKWSHSWSGGVEVPVEGIENGTIISKMGDNNTADDVLKIGGKTVQTVHVVLSSDGRSLTATIDGTDPQGRKVHDVEIFDKQQ